MLYLILGQKNYYCNKHIYASAPAISHNAGAAIPLVLFSLNVTIHQNSRLDFRWQVAL